MKELKCPICLSQNVIDNTIKDNNLISYNIQPKYEFKFENIFKNQNLYICKNCHFAFSYPFMNSNILNDFYNQGWSKDRLKSMIIESKKTFRPNPNILFRIFKITEFIKLDENFTFLDLGGSDGHVAQTIKWLFPKSYSYVSDNIIYKKCWKYRNVLNKDLENFENNTIDVLFCSHTLEHFTSDQLNNFISNIHDKIKKDGIIYFEVPNEDFYKAHENNYNIKYQVGPHLSHFNRNSLIFLFSKKFNIKICEVRGKENRYGIRYNKNVNQVISNKKNHILLNFIYRFKNKILKNNNLKIYKNDFFMEVNNSGDYLYLIAKK